MTFSRSSKKAKDRARRTPEQIALLHAQLHLLMEQHSIDELREHVNERLEQISSPIRLTPVQEG